MIYNLIVNKNNYGSDRMTTLLQGFVSDYNIRTSFIDRYLKHIGNIDKDKKVEDFPYNLTDVLIATARSVNSEKNQKVPMLLVNTDNGPVYKIKIEGRFGYRDFKTPIEKISGEPNI